MRIKTTSTFKILPDRNFNFLRRVKQGIKLKCSLKIDLLNNLKKYMKKRRDKRVLDACAQLLGESLKQTQEYFIKLSKESIQ